MIYFTAHTFKCVCHCRRAMFRVLGMYNFDTLAKLQKFSLPTLLKNNKTYNIHWSCYSTWNIFIILIVARINNWKAIGHDLPADPIDCCFSCRKETPEKLINFSCLLWIGSAAVFAHGTSFHSDKNDEEQFVTAGEFCISSHLTNYAHSVRVLSTTVHCTVVLHYGCELL